MANKKVAFWATIITFFCVFRSCADSGDLHVQIEHNRNINIRAIHMLLE